MNKTKASSQREASLRTAQAFRKYGKIARRW